MVPQAGTEVFAGNLEEVGVKVLQNNLYLPDEEIIRRTSVIEQEKPDVGQETEGEDANL